MQAIISKFELIKLIDSKMNFTFLKSLHCNNNHNFYNWKEIKLFTYLDYQTKLATFFNLTTLFSGDAEERRRNGGQQSNIRNTEC